MNIFERKSQNTTASSLPLSPIDLYQTCSYKQGYGYLRGVQEEVLNIWHGQRDQRDTICKMSTGSGKTLTGLLMLYSKLVEGVGPCVFVCPDKQLLQQTLDQAKLYGIPVCTFASDTPGQFPEDFMNGKSILVCHFQKLFNGKSIFNRDKVKLGGVLLDDAHKCVDIARDQTTIKIDRGHEISVKLFELFKSSLKEQTVGDFSRLEGGDPAVLMKVPYWSWIDNHENIVKIINDFVSALEYDSNDSLKFSWNLIVNNLLAYDCYISGDLVEITPIHVPYHEISAFHDAKHRFILSATFEDDYDLIKDLGISYNSLINPILPSERKDVGKRLILAPSRFDTSIDDNSIRDFIKSYSSEEAFNVIILVPSFSKAKDWEEKGAILVDKENIEDSIQKLKTSKGNFMVFVNRYDGIDLYDDLCRILVIDGLPKFTSLMEHYAEVRMESRRASRKAQILEQGLGRSSRSGGDYSVTYLMGSDLMSFVGYEFNKQFFTPITRKQLEMGLSLLDGESTEDSLKIIKEIANYCLTEDKFWIDYHTKGILDISTESDDNKNIDRLYFAEIERQALENFRKRRFEESATKILTDIVNKEGLIENEKAWYYQLSAQMLYPQSKPESNNLQVKAYDISSNMFYPHNGNVTHRKIKSKSVQAAEIIKNIKNFSTPNDVLIELNRILKNLIYSPDIIAGAFEQSLMEIGDFIGFSVQRPEKKVDNGPDVLWCLTNGHFLILEAKSRAIHSEISRDDVNQLLGSEQWFKERYPESSYTLITLQKPSRKHKNANIDQDMRVIDEASLEKLRNNLSQFVKALIGKPNNAHTNSEIEELLVSYKLTSELILETYLKKIQ